MTELKLEFNTFYVPVQNKIYVCWKKSNNIENYTIYRNSNELISSEEGEFKRPQEFDIDHWTELFRPDTRNWLCFKDDDIQHFQEYSYQVIGIGGNGEVAKSRIITIVTK